MPKQSKKNLKRKEKYQLIYDACSLNGCCGIGEIQNFTLEKLCRSTYVPDDECYEQVEQREELNYDAVLKEVRNMTRAALREFRCCILTEVDNYSAGRALIKAALECGWREDRVSKSRHGRYNIHLLSIQRPKKKPRNAKKDG